MATFGSWRVVLPLVVVMGSLGSLSFAGEGSVAIAQALGLPSALDLPTEAVRPPLTQLNRASVLRVVDGQTLMVKLIDDGVGPAPLTDRIIPITLVGLEAPDAAQRPWSYYAGQYLQDVVNRQGVYLEVVSPSGRGDRLQAFVWQGDTLVNEQMILLGHARRLDNAPRYQAALTNAETVAQSQGRGIWNYYSPLR